MTGVQTCALPISRQDVNPSDPPVCLLHVPRLDQMFTDAFSKDHQLLQAEPRHSLYLACALLVRGDVQVSDLRRNIERSENRRPRYSFVHPLPRITWRAGRVVRGGGRVGGGGV